MAKVHRNWNGRLFAVAALWIWKMCVQNASVSAFQASHPAQRANQPQLLQNIVNKQQKIIHTNCRHIVWTSRQRHLHRQLTCLMVSANCHQSNPAAVMLMINLMKASMQTILLLMVNSVAVEPSDVSYLYICLWRSTV